MCTSVKNVGRGGGLIHSLIDISVHSQAAVRALDTMADFAMKKNSSVKLTKFVVAGASKVITDVASGQRLCSILCILNFTWSI